MKNKINKGMPKGVLLQIERAIPKAEAFIKAKYPHINIDEVKVNFSNTRNGSNYIHAQNGATEFINIGTRTKIYLYKRVSCGLTSPHDGLNVGSELQIICSLIHELTHFIQGVEKRLYSEVETTENEIEYLKANEPFWYSRLVPIN